MAVTNAAPGVYYQTVDAGAPEVTPFRTDIAGFVGLAERGPIDTPVPVQSWRQFASWFGSFTPYAFLAYAVRGFFENGGRRCWIVRVASRDEGVGAVVASAAVANAGGDAWRVRASSEGTWGNTLRCTLEERHPAQVTATSTSPDGAYSVVPSVTGFGRGTHVHIRQAGAPASWKVVADVDPHERRVYWVHPDRRRRLPYDSPLPVSSGSAPVLLDSVEYVLSVTENGRLIRFYEGLTMIPESAGYAPTRLAAVTFKVDPSSGPARPSPPEPVVVEDLRADPTDLRGLDVDLNRPFALTGGHDGLAALAVRDFYGEPIAPDDGPVAVAYKRRGLRALEDVSEVAVLAIPDAQVRPIAINPISPVPPCEPDPCVDNPPPQAPPFDRSPAEQPPAFGSEEMFRIQSEMVLQCELKRDRFALLDPPFEAARDAPAGMRDVLDWRARFDSKFAALYFPWLRVVEPISGAQDLTRAVPPSGHVAGVYAATDLDVGVHHAPANRRLAWTVDATADLDDARHGILNTAGVDAIRTTDGRGLRVLGARTTSSDPTWRFVNVRRLMSMIEKALGTALQWAVFEPNDVITRARITMSITIFLLGLHEAGMFAGATPDESFLVRCDLDTNPPAERDLGHLIAEISVAPSKPFEFVLVRVGRVGDSLEVTDAADAFSAAEVGV
jgi:phage tail sheath protein FI